MSQKVKTWESHVPGCFGGSDHIFAGHPAEEKRAKELRKVCSEQRIPMDDVAKAIEHFLKSKKVGDALIQEQVERAKILEAVVTALSAHRDTAGRNRPQPRRTVRAAAPECRIGAPQRALFLCPSSNPARRRFASLASSPGMFFLLQHAAPHLLSF